MQASDIMTTDVVTVSKDAVIRDVAKMMFERQISAMPVVDSGGKLVGIISEGDLLRRAELKTERQRPWWLEVLAGNAELAKEFVHAHGRKAADVMTRDVVTAAPDTPLAEIADLLEQKHIKRVPIVSKGELVGIVSRANLLHALATLREEPAGKAIQTDGQIREQVMAAFHDQPWRPWLFNATVRKGKVNLWGIVDTMVEKDAARVAAEEVPGVVAVQNNLLVRPKNWWQAGRYLNPPEEKKSKSGAAS